MLSSARSSRRLIRTLLSLSLTVAVCGGLRAPLARAEEPTSPAVAQGTPSGQSPAAAGTTRMIGSLPPEVVGRWLFVIRATTDMGDAASTSESVTADDGKTTTVTRTQVGGDVPPLVRTLELSGKDAQARLVLHPGPFPADLQKQLFPGKAAAGEATPGAVPPMDPQALADVDRRWSELARTDPGGRAVSSKLLDYRNVSDEDKQRLGVPSVRLIIVTDEAFEGKKTVQKNVSTFAVEQMTPQRLEGQFLGAMVMPPLTSGNVAIPPVPVVLKGRFVAYNLDAVGGAGSKGGSAGTSAAPVKAVSESSSGSAQPSGSLVERLLGMFSGCGSR